MKKRMWIFLLLLIFVMPFKVNASLKTNVVCDAKRMDETLMHQIKTCYIDVTVTDDDAFYSTSGKFTMINTSLKGSMEAADKRIKITNQDLNNLTFVSETPIKNETIRIAKFTIFLAENGQECKVTWEPKAYGMNFVCEIRNGYYYDKNGNSVTEVEYNKQCNPHTCEIIDGTYFDKSGNIVNETEYNKQCISHSCEIIDNTYFDKSGNIVDQTEYSKQCESHSCQIIGGVYFDKNGNSVTEVEYDKQCNKHFCKIIDGTYFGKNGNIIDKSNYSIECPTNNPHTDSSSVLAYILIGLLVTTFISIIMCIKQNNKKTRKF